MIDQLYLAINQDIWKKKWGTATRVVNGPIVQYPQLWPGSIGITKDPNYLYVVGFEHGVQRLNYNGTGRTVLIYRSDLPEPNDYTRIHHIAIDTLIGKMFFNDCYYGRILKANLDGSNIEVVHNLDLPNGFGGYRDIALDEMEQKIYTSVYYGLPGSELCQLRRMDYDGSNITILASDPALAAPFHEVCFDTDCKKIFWTYILIGGLGGIRSSGIAGGVEETVKSDVDSCIDFDKYSNKLIYLDIRNGSVYQCDSDGSNTTLLLHSDEMINTIYPSGYGAFNCLSVLAKGIDPTPKSADKFPVPNGPTPYQQNIIFKTLEVNPSTSGIADTQTIEFFNGSCPIEIRILDIKAISEELDVSDFNGVGGTVTISVQTSNTISKTFQLPIQKTWNTVLDNVECKSMASGSLCFNAPVDGVNSLHNLYTYVPKNGSMRAILSATVKNSYSGNGSRVKIRLSIGYNPAESIKNNVIV